MALYLRLEILNLGPTSEFWLGGPINCYKEITCISTFWGEGQWLSSSMTQKNLRTMAPDNSYME